MMAILSNYFKAFLHPFEVYKSRRPENLLTLMEAISVSWIFAICQAIYVVLSILLGVVAADSFQEMNLPISWEPQKVMLIYTIAEVILFPLWAWLYAKVWAVFISFAMRLFNLMDSEQECSEKIDEIVSVAYTSHVFLMVPVFGAVIKFIAFLLYLFAGLKKNLNLSSIQSIFVILSPLLLIMLLVAAIITLLLIIFSNF